MRTLLVSLLAAFSLAAYAGEEKSPAGAEPAAKPAEAAKLPPNRHDPEDRSDSASTGASSEPDAAREGAPAAATDLGKEADKEDEAFRKRERESKKP